MCFCFAIVIVIGARDDLKHITAVIVNAIANRQLWSHVLFTSRKASIKF